MYLNYLLSQMIFIDWRTLPIPLLIAVGAGILLYFFRKSLAKGGIALIGLVAIIPAGYRGKILSAARRVVMLNWYTFLILFLFWLLIMLTEIGSDMVALFVSEMKSFSPFHVFAFISVVFLCTLVLSLSTWIIPFFMYSQKRKDKLETEFIRFYLATKLLAVVAMIPFMIIINRFLWFPNVTGKSFIGIVALNLVPFVCFTFAVAATKFFEEKLKNKRLSFGLLPWIDKKIKNRYVAIIFKILILIIPANIITIIFSRILDFKFLSLLMAVFLFYSAVVTYRLMLYSNEEGGDYENRIKTLVKDMIDKPNTGYSRVFYMAQFFVLLIAISTLYILPSLERVSALYILLILFSFYIHYFDLWRNVFMNFGARAKVIATVATIVPLLLPFFSNRNQFTVPFITLSPDIARKTSLEKALLNRIDYINSKNPGSPLYIVCGMGGGSRAGFITATVLDKLDQTFSGFWNQTICYSTVSGGSVGVYNYLKAKEAGRIGDKWFYKNIYQRNYNASGVFGLLMGDGLEKLWGSVATVPRSWFSDNSPELGFHDRNQRIRTEYDLVLKYCGDNNSPNPKIKLAIKDSFQTYFERRGSTIPIHLVNTFEINNGRRTVISPFPSTDSFFTNSILPLQDKVFDPEIERKEITYRQAVNLSELFPIVSAASYIGKEADYQFVDGGYYENYGLATANDVYQFLLKWVPNARQRVKIILIRNSEQTPSLSDGSIQLLAPVIGALNSPFTGHANHLMEEARRTVDSNFYVITFRASEAKVPLTRTLTEAHVDSMNRFIDSLPFDYHLKRFIEGR